MAVLLIIIRCMFNKNVLCSRGEALEGSDSEEEDDIGEFPGRREVIAFLNWLTFCDKVRGAVCKVIRDLLFRREWIVLCNPLLHIIYIEISRLFLLFILQFVGACDGTLGSSICSTIREVFLEGVLRGMLNNEDEDTISLYLAITAKIITSVSSPLLVNS